jgi:PncC family amidohydrolase
MAQDALLLSATDISVSVTGIAGPDGGTLEKPVGTVYICVATSKVSKLEKYHFEGDRSQVRMQTVSHALAQLTLALANY